MIEAWRITKARYPDEAFSGRGARLRGGRFNSEGIPMVYTAGSLALAVLELLANLPSNRHLRLHLTLPVHFDEDLMETLSAKELPEDWRAAPVPPSAQALGDRWTAPERSLVLRAPSAVVPAEFNYLINPLHPDSPEIEIGETRALDVDPRLLR